MRREEVGINWIWYFTSTKEDSEKWYMELTNKQPKDYDIVQWKGEWAFRLHK